MPDITRYTQDLPNLSGLSAEHARELLHDSAIDPEVVQERGYRTMERPNRVDRSHPSDSRVELQRLGFPSWSIAEDYYFPGLHIPQYSPSGVKYAGQWKPFRPVSNRDGKPMKYASARGPARLDVHPRWTRDRGAEDAALVPYIQDPGKRLWITEGVKKADALTSRGECTVALAGVYNWRNVHSSLGDWEDVRIKGREIIVCFDADAVTKPHVAQAMARLGKWLKHKGASKVNYLVVPSTVDSPLGELKACKGVDDYFAAGGSIKGLEQAWESKPPQVTDTDDKFTDARLAETLTNELLDGQYIWAAGMEWLRFNGRVWADVTEVTATESVRQWALDKHGEAVTRLRLDDKAAASEVDGWRGLLAKNRASTVLSYARGLVERRVEDLDIDADHINTPSGYLHLDSGETHEVGGDEYPTKITGAAFDPDAKSALWDGFVERILPDQEVREFVQRLLGYSLLGEVREHVMPIWTGSGRNGKGTMRDAIMKAFGDYALEVDPELLMTTHNPRHLTFLMELRGRRLVFCSETEKGRAFAESTMKRLVGGDPIQANKMRQDPITFLPSHTLIMCTNHLPKVSGDDPAVWARILVVPFDVVIPEEEQDGRLPKRLQEPDVSRAVLAWVYAGYRAYMEQGLNAPVAVKARTASYRAESDLTGRFVADCLATVPDGRITAKALYEAYVAWWREEGDKDSTPLGKRELGAEMIKRGFQASKYGGAATYKGVTFKVPEQGE